MIQGFDDISCCAMVVSHRRVWGLDLSNLFLCPFRLLEWPRNDSAHSRQPDGWKPEEEEGADASSLLEEGWEDAPGSELQTTDKDGFDQKSPGNVSLF